MLEAIERIRHVLGDTPLDAFEADCERQWLVERGVEIVSEASRHLPPELKARQRPMARVAAFADSLTGEFEIGKAVCPIASGMRCP